MTTVEDRLRAMLAERTASVPLDPEPVTGVRRRIRRTRQLRAAGVAAVVAVVGLGAGLAATTSTSDDAGLPAGSQLGAISHIRFESVAARTVPVPASGLTFRVDCRGTSQLVIRVAGKWFGGVDCVRAIVDRLSIVAALPPARYAAYGLHRGGQALVEVTDTDPADRQRWTVHVTAGVPAIVQRLAPQASALPADPDLEPGRPGVATPVAGHPDEAVDVPFTVPAGDIMALGECYGPGELRVQVRRTGAGRPLSEGTTICSTLFGPPERDAGEIDTVTLRGSGIRPGDHLVLRVIPSGFTRPTWRAAVQRITHDRAQIPLP